MTEELRTGLWNVLWEEWLRKDLQRTNEYDSSIPAAFLFTYTWANYFKHPLDQLPRDSESARAEIRYYFFDCGWYEVYDFIEFILAQIPDQQIDKPSAKLNFILHRELAGYRVINRQIVPITDENEIEAITEAISESPFSGARIHLRQALELLSNRETPDYRHSMNDSILAVESAAKEITGDPKATLGEALKKLERSRKLHPALKDAYCKLYGYTSDADGIRHAMSDEPNLTLADAKYFLVVCSAFVNYLAEKKADSGVSASK